MLYLPPLRRFLLPALVFVALTILYRAFPSSTLPAFVLPAPASPPGLHVSQNLSHNVYTVKNNLSISLTYAQHRMPGYNSKEKALSKKPGSLHPKHDLDLQPLFECPRKPNQFTRHIRLPNLVRNISQIPPQATRPDSRAFWNPTIIALPHWSANQYLLVERILTDGNHQENVLCEANLCEPGISENSPESERRCTPDDLFYLGPAGGLRCAHSPISLSLPPTPAEKCEGKFTAYADIPGFHDPRIFWSGKGEPLMMMNTQSRYACFGLWVIDLRAAHSPLDKLLSSSPSRPSLGPLKSYATMTELTRNPVKSRGPIEKNWMLFWLPNGEAFIHYDLPATGNTTRGRTFAKMLGNGLTTVNLTDHLEVPCLREPSEQEPSAKHKRELEFDKRKLSKWHQATNALRLILCDRSDTKCTKKPNNTVFIALIHRKVSNALKLPMRYERVFMVWSSTPPFHMLGVSKHPILMWNETTLGWTPSESWDDDPVNARIVAATKAKTSKNATEPFGGKTHWASFTYTVSISYAWGRKPRKGSAGDESEDMHVGYLDDEVVLAIGVDDEGGVFSKVEARELVQCMRACGGRVERGRNETWTGV